MYKQKYSILTTEAIEFQRDNFGSKLELLLEEMKDFVIKNNIKSDRELENKTKYFVLLKELIFKRLGIKLIFDTTDYPLEIAIWYNKILTPHVLDNKWKDTKELFHSFDQKTMEEYVIKYLPIMNKMLGQVDLKNAKLSGSFSESEARLICNFTYIFTNNILNIKELIAGILHEIGHLFTDIELSDRLIRSNQVLSDLSKKIKNNKDLTNIEHEVKEIADYLNIDKKEIDEILNSKNRVSLGFNLFSKIIKTIDTEVKNDTYNQVTSEQLADNFAVRFGYGRYIVSGLEKLGSSNRRMLNGIVTFLNIVWILDAIIISLMTIIGFFAIPFFLFIDIYIFSYVIFMMILTNSLDNTELTYDEAKTRYNRIKHQYIEYINQNNLSKEELKENLEAIYFIDEVMKKAGVNKNLFDKFRILFSSRLKGNLKEIEIQQLVEELAHNNLFVKSAEFDLLTKPESQNV